MRLLFIALLCLLVAMPLSSSELSGVEVAGVNFGAGDTPVPGSPDYRTVVVFGDTQDAMKASGELSQFTEMIQWVIDQKGNENIDAVLHVGDAIDLGTFAPLGAACDGATQSLTFTECLANGTPAACSAYNGGDGCYWSQDCISCGIMANGYAPGGGHSTDIEWTNFLAAWNGLNGVVPHAIVAGNHDNPGPLGTGGYPDRNGQRTNTDATYWETVETSFDSVPDRYFEHIKTVDHGAEGLSHTFRIQIGDQPVIVIAPAYQGGQQYDPTVISWVQNEVTTYGQPVWLLAHDTSQFGGDLFRATYNPDVGDAEDAIFAVSSGHAGPSNNVIELRTDKGHPIIRAVQDYSCPSGNPSCDGDNWAWFTVFRFYMDTNEVEVFEYNPVLDPPQTVAGLAKQSFTIPSSGLTGTADPYDLGTLPSMVADIEWAEPPVTTSTVTVCASGCDETVAQFNAHGWGTGANSTRYEMASGTYAAGTLSCNNCEFVGETGATIDLGGTLTISGSAHHVSFSGWWDMGRFDSSGEPTDLFMDNVHMVADYSIHGQRHDMSGTELNGVPWQRWSFINTTFDVINWPAGLDGGWAFWVQATPGPDNAGNFEGQDLILANVRLESERQTYRIQSVENTVIIDSASDLNGVDYNDMRFHHAMTDLYVKNFISVGANPATASSTIDIVNAEFDNITRYMGGNGPQLFCFAGGSGSMLSEVAGTCEFKNSQGYAFFNLGTVPTTCSCDSIGNQPSALWDGVTLPDPGGIGRPGALNGVPYGADHVH